MAMFDLRVPCVFVMVCVLRLGDTVPIACQFAGIDALQSEPTAVGRRAAAEPERQTLEKFMVWSEGYWLLEPDGKEKEHLHIITNGMAAISPNERWVAFGEYTPTSAITMRKYEVSPNSQMRKWVFSFFKVLAWWR
jgi:hypothetical protein